MAHGAPKSKRQYHGKNTKGRAKPAGKAPKAGKTVEPIKANSDVPDLNAPASPRPNTGVAFVPTTDQRMTVRLAAAMGFTQEQICRLINFPHGVSVPTLEKHFRAELDHGTDFVNLAVVTNLFRMATGNGKSAGSCAIFWAKSRLKWRTADGDLSMTAKGETQTKDGEKMPFEFTLKIGERDGSGDDDGAAG